MEKLKVGQSFEVVEAQVTDFDIKRGKHYISIVNEVSNYTLLDDDNYCYVMFNEEVKPIGKLTITKIK